MALSIILIILGAILIIISKIVMYADEKRHELKREILFTRFMLSIDRYFNSHWTFCHKLTVAITAHKAHF